MLATLLAAFASAETGAVANRIRRSVRDYALAAIAAVIGLGFLLGAAFVAVADRYGGMPTAIGFGIGFLLLAGMILAYHRISARIREKRAMQRRSVEMKSIAGAAAVTALPLLARAFGAKGLLLPFVALAALAVLREQSGRSDEDDQLDD